MAGKRAESRTNAPVVNPHPTIHTVQGTSSRHKFKGGRSPPFTLSLDTLKGRIGDS
jgi:hypothetical protein